MSHCTLPPYIHANKYPQVQQMRPRAHFRLLTFSTFLTIWLFGQFYPFLTVFTKMWWTDGPMDGHTLIELRGEARRGKVGGKERLSIYKNNRKEKHQKNYKDQRASAAQTKWYEKGDSYCHFCPFLKTDLFLPSAPISKLDLECCGLHHFKAFSF